MLGRVRLNVLRAGLAVMVALLALPASAQLQNPGNVLFELIDQFQTGRNRPVLYGAQVQQIVNQQTLNTGIYESLRRLGTVRNIQVKTETPLRGGVLYHLTARHDRGTSHWDLGYSSHTRMLEYVYFTVGNTETGPTSGTGGTKPVAPGTVPNTRPPPTTGPTATPPAPPPTTTPPPTRTTGIKPLAPPGGANPTPNPPPSNPPPSRTDTPQRPPITTPTPPSNPTRPPTSTDTTAACQKFPNLC